MSLTQRLELAGLKREHARLSALLAAVLLKTGPVTLTAEEAEAVHESAELRYESVEDGGLKVWVEA